MKNDDTTDLKKFIRDELRAVKDIVEITKNKIDTQEAFLHVTTENVRTIKDQISVINEKLDEHTDLLENQIRPSVIFTETTIKSYKDMYAVNNSNDKKLEKRIEVLVQ